MFVLLAQRDEIAKLKIQEGRQTQANLEKIKGGRGTFILAFPVVSTRPGRINLPSVSFKDLEKQVEDFKKQIQDKTQMIDSSNLRVSELCK